MRRIKGFTLIELVVVILLLGIISVVAVPKFVNIRSESHVAIFKSTFGAFKTAMANSHLKWKLAGSPKGIAARNIIGTLDFNSLGLPAGVDDGAQVSSPQDCIAIFREVMDTSLVLQIPASGGGGIKNLSSEVDIAVTHNNNTCYYTFVSESKEVGYNADQFRYYYLTGEIVIYEDGFTLV